MLIKNNNTNEIFEITAKKFAFDNCHKIYILEDKEDLEQAEKYGYDILPISSLEIAYNNSCPLKFINNWKLDKVFIGQFESGEFFIYE